MRHFIRDIAFLWHRSVGRLCSVCLPLYLCVYVLCASRWSSYIGSERHWRHRVRKMEMLCIRLLYLLCCSVHHPSSPPFPPPQQHRRNNIFLLSCFRTQALARRYLLSRDSVGPRKMRCFRKQHASKQDRKRGFAFPQQAHWSVQRVNCRGFCFDLQSNDISETKTMPFKFMIRATLPIERINFSSDIDNCYDCIWNTIVWDGLFICSLQ